MRRDEPGSPLPRSLFQQVVDRLGRSIVGGAWPPGTVLAVENELAAELGVGRNLLREAVKVLASKGLVEVRPKHGTRVLSRPRWNMLDPDVLGWLATSGQGCQHGFDLIEVRLILEPQASRLAALRATAEERQGIEARCAALEGCAGHPELVPQHDLAFHQAIYAASGNALIASLGWLLRSMMQAQVRLSADAPGAIERSLPLHREVADAILAQDADWAEATTRRLVLVPYGTVAERLRVPEERRLLASRRERGLQAI